MSKRQRPECALEKLATRNSENLEWSTLNSAKYSFTKQNKRASNFLKKSIFNNQRGGNSILIL